MQFKPCIDIHNGKVKQIVGDSLIEEENKVSENFVSKESASFFAKIYKEKNILGGHIILLNAIQSDQYALTRSCAVEALMEYPGGLQVGGGITPENATDYLNAGASHVIVTSYVFKNGQIHYKNLNKMKNTVGKDKLVLDLSCRKKDGAYYIVTDRWQKYTDVILTEHKMEELSEYCDEFLIHAVDVEGKASGIETNLVKTLSKYAKEKEHVITYAGGVHSFEDLRQLKELGHNRIDVTIGSALDLFGGSMNFEEVLAFINY